MSTIYKGIDISLYQGNPNFEKVHASGVDFVMHKAGQGRLADGSYNAPFIDPKFTRNIKAASQIGDDFYQGSYWYFMANTEEQVREEAKYYIELLKPYKYNHQLWAAVDVEDPSITTNYKTLSKHVEIFCHLVACAGFRPMVYANSYWLDHRFKAPKNVPIWEANWSAGKMSDRARMWQYSSKGAVDGISGNVDVNVALDIIGDANNDGKVDNKDVITMIRKMSGWNVPINESQADLDQDGYVTMKDLVKLMRRLSGRK